MSFVATAKERMESMNELIEALRCRSNDIRQCERCAFKDACYGGTLELIAADAIERLGKTIEQQYETIAQLEADLEAAYNH